jgi:flagellin-like hook-associated protein FlgL
MGMGLPAITPTLVQTGWLASVDQIQQQLTIAQGEAASGLAFTTPDQNPVGTAAVDALDGQLTATAVIQHHLTTAQNTLTVVTGALSQMVDLVDRANQLALTFANPGTAPGQSAAVAQATALRNAFVGLLNTESAGQYVFAAANPLAPVATTAAVTNLPAAGAAPWAWVLPTGPGSSTPVTLNGFEPGVAVGTQSGWSVALNALNALIAAIPTGQTGSAQQALVQAQHTLATAVAVAGTYQDAVQIGQTAASQQQTALQAQRASIQDANLPAVLTTLSTEQTELQAALQAGNALLQADLWTVIKP